jgi:hypothetical protein
VLILRSFSDDPRSGLVHVFAAGRLLFRGCLALFGSLCCPAFFQFSLVLIFHGDTKPEGLNFKLYHLGRENNTSSAGFDLAQGEESRSDSTRLPLRSLADVHTTCLLAG